MSMKYRREIGFEAMASEPNGFETAIGILAKMGHTIRAMPKPWISSTDFEFEVKVVTQNGTVVLTRFIHYTWEKEVVDGVFTGHYYEADEVRVGATVAGRPISEASYLRMVQV